MAQHLYHKRHITNTAHLDWTVLGLVFANQPFGLWLVISVDSVVPSLAENGRLAKGEYPNGVTQPLGYVSPPSVPTWRIFHPLHPFNLTRPASPRSRCASRERGEISPGSGGAKYFNTPWRAGLSPCGPIGPVVSSPMFDWRALGHVFVADSEWQVCCVPAIISRLTPAAWLFSSNCNGGGDFTRTSYDSAKEN